MIDVVGGVGSSDFLSEQTVGLVFCVELVLTVYTGPGLYELFVVRDCASGKSPEFAFNPVVVSSQWDDVDLLSVFFFHGGYNELMVMFFFF